MELTLFVEHQCNLRCTYCYNGSKFKATMPWEVAEKAIRTALSRSPGPVFDLSFFGGEPLLRLGLVRRSVELAASLLPSFAPRPKLRVLMNTNGTLLDNDAIALLAPNPLWQSTVFVSLDGPRDVHDKHRVRVDGKGSYDDVVRGMRRSLDAGISTVVMAVVGTKTAERMGESLELFLSLGVSNVLFNLDYHDDWDEASIEKLKAGLRAAGEVTMAAFRKGAAPLVDPLHTKILSHMTGGLPCAGRCTLDTEVAVAPSGRLYPCGQMIGEDRSDQLVIGHVDTWIDRDRVAKLQKAKNKVEDTCAPCALRERCQSHCGCRHVALTGELGRIDAVLCETETAVIQEADRVAQILHEEQCPAFLRQYYQRTWKSAPGAVLMPLRLRK